MLENKILILDDEEALTSLLKKMLEQEGFRVSISKDTVEGYKKILKLKPSLAVIDINMPTVGGLELSRILRKDPMTKNLPIIMLTVDSAESSKIAGFKNGIDDYIVKPFSNKELVARIRALLNRVHRRSRERVKKLEHDGLVMLLDSRTVTLNKKQLLIRPKEFDLLYALMSKPNIVLNRDFILENVFEYDIITSSSRTIDTHIKNLRSILGPWAKHIVTVFGLGIKFVPSPK
ncbi:MAG: response regulator transcription factor [Endomicrobium sp.]|jgi:DNA-binding response OmpR family regulator|nr:response regulator transcription factor [Endomicrobium sp.]